ncbi:hypothetical protein SAMN02745108_00509 [Fibrobacter intestinalis]|uniref:Uncharacterized protein n=1 Tax=Fibrobacter intestinalis TaxID=28122 RepID=A0A1T4KHP8_9BACT|nr:hypothetical protein BGW94_1415 [Fibrobacter sp. NR9]SJZ41877.1 hypothetical protein SAMN02745108_00509 [Fibrobacter intestinalis]
MSFYDRFTEFSNTLGEQSLSELCIMIVDVNRGQDGDRGFRGVP